MFSDNILYTIHQQKEVGEKANSLFNNNPKSYANVIAHLTSSVQSCIVHDGRAMLQLSFLAAQEGNINKQRKQHGEMSLQRICLSAKNLTTMTSASEQHERRQKPEEMSQIYILPYLWQETGADYGNWKQHLGNELLPRGVTKPYSSCTRATSALRYEHSLTVTGV